MVDPQKIHNKPCEDFIKNETEAFIERKNINSKTDIKKTLSELYEIIYNKINEHNVQTKKKEDKWPMPRDLHPEQMARVLAASNLIKRIAPYGLDIDPKYDILCWYNNGDQGNNDDIYMGTYRHYTTSITRYIGQLVWYTNINKVKSYLFDMLPRTPVFNDPDFIPVNNGIFNYKTKELWPFTDRLVFLSKLPINYNPEAVNPVITYNDTKWDIESWFKDITSENDNSKELTELIWRIIGASIRPNINWKKGIILYSNKTFPDYYTRDGKWTISMLIDNLCKESALDMSYENFINHIHWGDDECIAGANVIISDNDRYYHDNLDDNKTNDVFKKIINKDVIYLAKKPHLKECMLRIKALLLCVFYTKPQVAKETTDFFKKQINIGFEKVYDKDFLHTIQNDFISRQDVLEYVLKKVLTMSDYYEL